MVLIANCEYPERHSMNEIIRIAENANDRLMASGFKVRIGFSRYKIRRYGMECLALACQMWIEKCQMEFQPVSRALYSPGFTS